MEVTLFKRKAEYKDKDGNEKTATNFYIKCGDELVPVECKFFKDLEGHDKNYNSRRRLLSAFAEVLPDKEPKK